MVGCSAVAVLPQCCTLLPSAVAVLRVSFYDIYCDERYAFQYLFCLTKLRCKTYNSKYSNLNKALNNSFYNYFW